MFETLFPEHLYQSYVIYGDPVKTPDTLLEFLKNKNYITPTSQDVFCRWYESLTVADCKDIKDWHSRKGLDDSSRMCIVSTKFINREAEQSLLKMLEEPGLRTHFFIIVPSSLILLDTIVSRVHVVHAEPTFDESEAINFMKLSKKDRIDHIARMIKGHESDETSGGLRHSAIGMINSIERVLHADLQKKYTDMNMQFVLTELAHARRYLSKSGASVKMILEHIALVV